jgi:hypothetical protein
MFVMYRIWRDRQMKATRNGRLTHKKAFYLERDVSLQRQTTKESNFAEKGWRSSRRHELNNPFL